MLSMLGVAYVDGVNLNFENGFNRTSDLLLVALGVQ